MKTSLKNFPIYPILFALYPALALLATNMGEVLFDAGVRVLVGSLCVGLLIMAAIWLFFRDLQPAALASAVVLLIGLSYGQFYSLLRQVQVAGIVLGRHRFLLPLSVILSVLGIIIARKKPFPTQWTVFLNMTSFILLVFPALQIGAFYLHIQTNPDPIQGVNLILEEQDLDQLPDIYYIILDEYPRADILAEQYHFDNEPFLTALEDNGFYVARESRSNYAQTELSLASSLNFNYLSFLVPGMDPASEDRAPLWPLIKQNAVMAYLEEAGYSTIAFETGYSWSQVEGADIYLGPSQGVGNTSVWGLSDFEVMFLRNTALLVLYDARLVLPAFMTPLLERPAREAYDRTELALEELAAIPELEGPHFVFAHLIVPHPPYVYGEDGEYIGDAYGPDGRLGGEDELYVHNVEGHRLSVAYINARLLALLPIWLEQSDVAPIIILQADHGVPFRSHEDRLSIFNAYYLPANAASQLYPEITPVNTFRIVLNQVLGTDFPTLEDVSYFSGYDQPYNFNVVQ